MGEQAIPKAPRALVDEQAEDEGLWFMARTAPEAYLQQELRRLHAAVEAEAEDQDALLSVGRAALALRRTLPLVAEGVRHHRLGDGIALAPCSLDAFTAAVRACDAAFTAAPDHLKSRLDETP